MTAHEAGSGSRQQDWHVSGVYGTWRMLVSWEPDGEPGAETPPPAARLWPRGRFDHLGDHFHDLVNLHELELDIP